MPRLQLAALCVSRQHGLAQLRALAVVLALRYRLTGRIYDSMPALKTWNFTLFPLAPKQVFQLSVPREAFGLRLKLEVFSDAAATQVAVATTTSTPYPNFCW